MTNRHSTCKVRDRSTAADAAEARCGTRRFVVVEVEHCLAERLFPETTLQEAHHTVGLLAAPA